MHTAVAAPHALPESAMPGRKAQVTREDSVRVSTNLFSHCSEQTRAILCNRLSLHATIRKKSIDGVALLLCIVFVTTLLLPLPRHAVPSGGRCFMIHKMVLIRAH